MELKYVNASKMKSLEDYMIALATGIISIKTLLSFHQQAINLGILKEDQECRANTIAWDCNRLIKLYFDQASSVGELLPPDFCLDQAINALKANELTTAKKMARNTKKSCAT